MQNGKFNHRVILGFAYRRKKSGWRLEELIGKRAAKDLGMYDVLRAAPSGEFPFHLHLANILVALAHHEQRLDGGSVSETLDRDYYRVEIKVKPRQGRPQHQEKVWTEPKP